MSIFPFINAIDTDIKPVKPPLAREYAYDFFEGDFKLRNGKVYLVEGDEALKIWITKALITSRYKEIIHTWSYGSEFEDKIIGRGYTKGLIKAEAERYATECILASLSDYVLNLRDFDISFIENTLKIVFTVETIYGKVELDVSL